ncbi:MAG: hypothetical protein HQK78_15715, partial [Desulfobacterales bacterium]|nr:hypothetical protein [Desulfobacterales bacterium]
EYIIEAKLTDDKASKNLIYFSDKYSLKGYQLVKDLRLERKINELIEVRAAGKFLPEM